MLHLPKSNRRIAELVFKHLVKQLTATEQEELDKWIAASAENQKQFNEMTNRAQLKLQLKEYNDVRSDAIWNKVYNEISHTTHSNSRKSWWIYSIAAALIPAIIIGGWWLYNSQSKKDIAPQAATSLNNDISPGRDQAILTLQDGRTIFLDSIQNGVLANQGGTLINKHNGRVSYNAQATTPQQAMAYNMISTPRGGQYHVLLADGSLVWLNASSSIRFPVAFTERDRVVSITGEAYFEIAQNPSHPFKVMIDDAQGKRAMIEVLGTHFNVNAYSAEPSIQTTLLEGKLKVAAMDKQLQRPLTPQLLSPGQQAQVTSAGAVRLVAEADTMAAVAWKNGAFRFSETDIKTVMRQLERWYDVEVVYQGKVPDIAFNGQISRYSNASKVLELLEMTGGVRFTIEGQKIFVLPPDK